MKPSVINAATAGNGSAGAGATNGVTIPINHEYGAQQQQRQHRSQSPHSQYPQQQQQFNDPSGGGGPGFAGTPAGGQRQFPAHFQQDFGFEPDMDDMFSRSRLGRMHDPFAGFGTRKRCGNDPQSAAPDGFSHYFNDDPDFDFPQFGTLGRRRAAAAAAAGAGQPIDPHASMGRDEHDFFNRLPSEFRQYIPDTFGHSRRSAAPPPSTMPPTQGQAYYAAQTPQKQQHQYYGNANNTPPSNSVGGSSPQSPSKKLCDAAIQTEDPAAGGAAEQLNQHSLRNTIDMGVKSTPESEEHGHRAHSAPPNEQQQQQQPSHANGKRRTPPPAGQHGTQTSPRAGARSPPFHKVYYAPQQHAHPQQQQQQQKQQTPPPPQTPGGTYVRTIPIYVEGRSEPIINSHKEIPNQNAASAGPASNASTTPRTHVQPPQHHQPQYPTQHHPQHQHQQQHRPTPFNTQQQHQQKPPQQPNTGAGAAPTGPPQTPHTMDSINKIQDIQRDVLDLMGKVEKFGGKRQDKEYAYLDEMLTRNLLKLDTIDTNGKDSIRLARKEAIKCIQASINVLEAKAEENARLEAAAQEPQASQEAIPELKAAKGQLDVTKEADIPQKQKRDEATTTAAAPPAAATEAQPVDATKIMEPIPLPPPEGVQVNSNKNDRNEEELQSAEQPTKESSPQRQEEAASATSITTAE